MREIHGLADPKRITAVGAADDRPVTVTDLSDGVAVSISGETFGSKLTPEQAEWLAKQLIAAARRVRKAGVLGAG